MPFIGIICDENSENWIRRELIKRLKLNESSVLFIKEKSIENIKNIKFETILLAREFENVENLKKILKNTKYLVINSDIENSLNLLDNLELTVITYGFNSKATITASSVTEESVIICIQRNIVGINGNIVEPQEIKINSNEESNIVMAMVTIICIYEKNNL